MIRFSYRYEHADSYGMYHDDELTSLVMANHLKFNFLMKELKWPVVLVMSAVIQNIEGKAALVILCLNS